MKLLIVEDEPNLLSVIKRGFSENNHDVSAAMDGTTALMMLENHHFDAVILDLMLPDIDGFGVCEILRREARTAAIPIVILTAWATTDARSLGLELGALDYLTKPFSPRELTSRVQRLLNLRAE